MNLANYNALLPLLDLLLSLQFTSHYNSLDLLLMIDSPLIMLMIDYCFYLDLEIKFID